MKRIGKRADRYLCFLSILLCVWTLLPLPAKAAEAKPTDSNVVRVAWYEDSYHITDKNGHRSGYGYEYEQAVAAYTGWEYEYVKGSWTELVEKLQAGEIDLMSALSYTDERAETMDFSDVAMGAEKYYLYADLEHSDISASDLSTLNGKSIAMMKESVQTTQFEAWEEKNNITTNHVFVSSIDEAKALLAEGKLQGVISTETSIWVDAKLSAIVLYGGSDIYYGINQNRPDLKEQLDTAMRLMENDKPFYSDELYETYIATQSVAVLSNDEKAWLQQHTPIQVGYVKNDTGFSLLKNGEIVGVINDYMDFANDCFEQPLEFELTGFDSFEEQVQALKAGDIDMIFHVSQNPYYAEENHLALSNTVLTIPVAAVTNLNAFDESESIRVAIARENAKFKWYVSYNYPDWEIIDYASSEEAKQAVRQGNADCFITRSGEAIRYVNDKNLHSIFLTRQSSSSFAVKKGNTELLSILNKTLKAMQTSKLTGAVSMYEDSAKKVTITDFIKDNLLVVSVSCVSVFLVILLIILRLLNKSRQSEAIAREAQTQAETANAAKSTFLFNMSHDMRTPMNALLGYNQLIKQGLTDPKLLDYQRKMEESGNLLLSIINNLLDMARIESGKVYLDENYAQVESLLGEIIEVFESTAKEKGIHLVREVRVAHPHVMCDATKVKQVFVNLLSNAVKYTPSGGTVTLRLQEIPCGQAGFIQFQTEVTDTGIGMSQEYIPMLFEPFSRERNTTTGKVAGTGLGMPIVKKLVEMMGGSISVESELGQGTKFTVILRHKLADPRYYAQNTPAAPTAPKEILRGKRILMAEDNDLNAEIATTMLENAGLNVERVEDGIQCVNKIEQMPADSYDLVLMDIQMPNMDGYKATEIIRKLPDKNKATIPIVAMTANAFEEDRRMAFSKGMNAHIAKPIDMEKMEEIISSVLK